VLKFQKTKQKRARKKQKKPPTTKKTSRALGVKMRGSLLELRASYLEEYTKNFSTLFGGLFSLYTTSKGRQVQSLASQR
jgi:hypothetical protein